MNTAIGRLPPGADIVGIQIVLAYVGPMVEDGAVEACGAAINKAQYPMPELARLFALYADVQHKGWAPHPERPVPVALRTPRRRPRR